MAIILSHGSQGLGSVGEADMQQIENWPRTIQENLHRFYQRVIKPVMTNTPVHKELITGAAPSMDVFLDRAAAMVDNYTANEANKVYALVLIALFERYLRLWAGHLFAGTDINTKRRDLMPLIDAVAVKVGIDLQAQDLRATLQEALLVGNVVRHGEGASLDTVRKIASHLIDRSKRDYVDVVDQQTPDSEWLRVRPQDIERYVCGMIRFWGLADKQPLSITSYFEA